MTTTASNILSAARYLVRDPDGNDLTDAFGLSIINNGLRLIHQTLLNVESDLIRAKASITTVDGTQEYTLETAGGSEIETAGILRLGIWEDENEGFQFEKVIKSELINRGYDIDEEGEPRRWYPVEQNKVGFHPVPDDEYTINVFYWETFKTVSATSSDIPYKGIFDGFLKYFLAMEYKNSIEADPAYCAGMAQNLWGSAMQTVYEYGITRWKAAGDMFDVEGI